MITLAPSEITQANIGNSLCDKDPAARATALRDLRSRRPGDALKVLPAVTNMLHDPDASVRREACDTIAWFGEEAVNAIDELKGIAVNKKEEPPVRSAAAKALPHIDRQDRFVSAGIRDLDHFGVIIELLDGSDEEEKALRGSLRREEMGIMTGPSPGYVRMQMKEIISTIVGPCPPAEIELDGNTTWRDAKDQNIRNWMAKGKLPSIRVAHGLYDVKKEALALCRSTNRPAARDLTVAAAGQPLGLFDG